MEKLPTHRILQFNPDTFEFVRKQLNLDKPGQMDAAIDLLDDWIKKQPHFLKKDFSREYLERTIILVKGSVERAKKQMDKLFTTRTSIPHFFEKTDSKHKDYEILHEHFVDAMLPKLTKDHYRIYFGKAFKDGIAANMFTHAYQFGTMIFEHTRSNDYCAGFVGILDYRDINIMELISAINIIELHQFISLITESYQMRVKGIHLLTGSKAVEILVRIFRQVFSKKIADRICVHTSVESLYEHLPKELLPKELGGEEKSLHELNKDWVEEFSLKENVELFEEMRKAQIDQNLRSVESVKNDLLGVSGSFRTLSVD